MELLSALDWLIAIPIVFGATEAITVMAIIASEVAGTAWLWPHQANRPTHHNRRSARLEGAAMFVGQVFVGTVSPYLVILVVAHAAAWIVGLAITMLVTGGIVGGLALGLAFLAGLTSPDLAVQVPETPSGVRGSKVVQRHSRLPASVEAA